MTKGLVISLCDKTTNMVRPWADNGYYCLCLDIQHPEGVTEVHPYIRLVGTNIHFWPNEFTKDNIAITFAFPPCTNLAVSGARWFKDKGLKGLIEGLALVEKCREICESYNAPYMIENPVSTLSTYWRKPDYTFQPCDYGGYLNPPGDFYNKKTCLWTGNGFVMPEKKPVLPTEGSKMHLMGPSEDRADLRSATPMGFAQAVFEANSV